MLIDYLEEISENLKNLEKQLVQLEKDYRLFGDREIREQMNTVKKDIKKIMANALGQLYLHLQELFLIKKYFPAFFQVLKEDQHLAKIIGRIDWLLEFKKLDQKTCKEELTKIKNQRTQLREVKDFLRNWVGKVDHKSLVATWAFLKNDLAKDMDRDEVSAILKKRNRELKRQGWLLLLNSYSIPAIFEKFSAKLTSIRKGEVDWRTDFEKTKGRGIYAQSDAEKKLKHAVAERRKMVRKCEHFLMANYEFILVFKKQKRTWLDQGANRMMKELIERIDVKPIDEKNWLVEMNKRLGV